MKGSVDMSSILMLKLMQFKRDIMVVLLMAALSIGFIFVLGGSNMGASRYKILLASDQISPSYNRFLEELRKNKTYDFEVSLSHCFQREPIRHKPDQAPSPHHHHANLNPCNHNR